MSFTHVSACWTCTGLQYTSPLSQYLHASTSYAYRIHTFPPCKAWPKLVYSSPKYFRSPLCLFGGKGKSENDNETSAWKALEKAMGGLRKETSVQDILREQMKEQEFGGGGFGSPPSNGGDGSGNSEGENFAESLDELLQVVLATIGFIFVYIYMIRGEEMTRLAKDYIRYLFGAKTSVRLRRAMYIWGRFYKRITRKKVVRKDWLERAIVMTPTWWHKPKLLARVMTVED
uniref:Autophagy-related protein 3 n=1 Tax=Anthurium amnicola TaxID=1678845 RepID=A0A1D1YCS9_9ARAE